MLSRRLSDSPSTLAIELAERPDADGIVPIRDSLSQTLDQLEALYENDRPINGTPTGFGDSMLVHNSLEQDADIVMFIYRDEVYAPDSVDRGTAEVIVAKHRNGPTGVARLAFLSHCTLFTSLAKIDGR